MIKERFKTPLARNIFQVKYSIGANDSWDALSERVVEDVCGSRWGTTNKLMSDGDRGELCDYIKRQLFIPGGRYLYYAGRPAKFFNNCLGAETKVLTDKGWRLVSKLGLANVISPVDGKPYLAEFKSHGVQRLYKITFSHILGKPDHTWTVRATKNHHWRLIDGSDTYDLRVGDVVPANAFNIPITGKSGSLGFLHGFMYGDGTKNADPVLHVNLGINWKELPKNTDDPEYIAGFIRGWISAYGSETTPRVLCSKNREALEWFREYAAFAGIVIIGKLRSQVRNVRIGKYEYKDHEIFIQDYQYGSNFPGFKVVKIELDSEEEVFCPFEPVHNRIIISHGIDTYQCYLLRAEDDTREEWADLTKRAMLCLMTGGGIGIDYSRLRASGKILSRTGGIASGPLPLMAAINEIGRNVMQGGSRRSAIYASLNWQHEDIPDFLKAKNWRDQTLGLYWSTGEGTHGYYTVADAKEANFNYPAPLDMTNISVNYDDKALKYSLLPVHMNSRELSLQPDGFDAKNTVFLRNCQQAMMTGEPGFSFNFGEKQNETLRNACCEVTSEDSDDVCNLGSINMGNIETLEEFKSVVALGAKFLVCGTLRADLPYDKVYKIREKNRRLGLGLMGIHEWLLKRGYKYEVVKELKKWLNVYKTESERAANEHCERLFISKPVAYRAIAPTGTIGILAATSTGIEPLYAVAYKRRYLTEGTRWKYQYVVDATAEHLIKSYDLDPDSIETATDLAQEWERRIKFQADVQEYVDMAISSTINLPSWGLNGNDESDVVPFANTLAKYATRLRGFTCYPDGSRGGQPITKIPYNEAVKHSGVVFEENDICAITGRGGTCGV